MDDLQTLFFQVLRERLTTLEKAQQQLDNSFETAVQTIRKVAHTLKGSGATYGYPALSESAGLLEELDDRTMTIYLPEMMDYMRRILNQQQNLPARVLIIDDDPLISRLIQSVLENLGYTIQIAETIDIARTLFRNEEFGLLFIDFMLPDGNGLDYLQELRADPQTAGIPAIVLSGKSAAHLADQSLRSGASEYLEKPVDPNEIPHIVARYLAPPEESKGQQKQLMEVLDHSALIPLFNQLELGVENEGRLLHIAIFSIDTIALARKMTNEDHSTEIYQRFLQILAPLLGKNETAAHYRSNRIIVLIPDKTEQQILQDFASIREQFYEEYFQVHPNSTLRGKVSMGYAAVQPGDSLDDTIARVTYLSTHERAAKPIAPAAPPSVAPAVAPPSQTAQADTGTPPGNLPKSRKILVAEDDRMISSLLKHRLEKAGYAVDVFGDGRAALHAAQANPNYDLVMLDIKMPFMDGFEVLRQLRLDTQFQKTPILVLTSMGNEKSVVRGIELGATEYILKPFSPVEIVARVNRLLAA